MTRQDLITRLTESNDITSKAAAGRILDIFETAIVDGLKADGAVHLGNNIGTLKVATLKAGTARVPGTDRVVEVAERKTVKFKASAALKRSMA